MKYADAVRMGKSQRAPRKPFESWHQRHKRRQEIALQDRGKLFEQCLVWNASLTIKNHGEHWIIKRLIRGSQFNIAEWWPSSAKLILEKDWKNGIHCHDVSQVIDAIEKAMGVN